MKRHAFNISLHVRSPVLCQGLTPAGRGIDATFLRDETGAPIIPGDHLKGLIRAGSRGDVTDGISFGAAPVDSDRTPHRGNIILSDLKLARARHRGEKTWRDLPNNAHPAGEATRVAIDEQTGVPVDGALQFVELIAPFDDELAFDGQVVVYASAEPGDVKSWLEIAVGTLPFVGSLRSLGFGEVIGCEVSEVEPVAAAGLKADQRGYVFDIDFDRPLLIASERPEANVFRSGEVIPGAAIKGCLAQMLQRRGLMTDAMSDRISQLRISHAFPLPQHGEQVSALPVPFALAKAGGRIEYDFLGSDEAAPPVFPMDWKGFDFAALAKALKGATGCEFTRLQRTRVSVGDLQVAADEKLFVYEMYPSRFSDGSRRRWRFRIDAGADLPDALAKLLGEGHIDGLGKTDAIGRLALLKERDWLPGYGTDVLDNAIVLTSEAVLLPMVPAHEKCTDYEAYFRAAFGLEDLEVTSFAMEKAIGGYQAQRYPVEPGHYRPWIVTQPGSTFLFKTGEAGQAQLKAKLDEVTRSGLPKPDWLTEGRDWRNDPFCIEAGYYACARAPKLARQASRKAEA